MEIAARPAVDPDHLRITQEINAIIEQKRAKHESNKDEGHPVSAKHAKTALEEAAQEAAIADGVLPSGVPDMDRSDGCKLKQGLRRGKWTPEEEAYAKRLIDEFKRGTLPLNDGTTLRTFLSKLLNCDPMRISKKFVGHNCIGKQVFRRRTADAEKLSEDILDASRRDLAELERRFLERVNQTSRTKPVGKQPTTPPTRTENIRPDPKPPSVLPQPGTFGGDIHTGLGSTNGQMDHHHLSSFPPHTLPWMLPPHSGINGHAPISIGRAANDSNGQQARNSQHPASNLQTKATDKSHTRQNSYNGTVHAQATGAYPSSTFDQSHNSASFPSQQGGTKSFPRTPSMEVLMNLPNMTGMPSIQSMENIAALGTAFPQVGAYAPQAGSMPWESLQYHSGYELGAFPMHNHDNGMGSFLMKPNFLSYNDHALSDASKGMHMSEQHNWTGMEPPTARTNAVSGLRHTTSADEFLALMDGEHEGFANGHYPPHSSSTTARSRGGATSYDARHHGSFQDMNKAEFQTSGKRRYDGTIPPAMKLPRSTVEPALAQADL